MPTFDGLTPMQALYHLLARTGYVSSKRNFAARLRIFHGNVYAYLADPEPRPGNAKDAAADKNTMRLPITATRLHGWCWSVEQFTDLRVHLELLPSGNLRMEAHGKDAQGQPIEPHVYDTTYVCDFTPPKHWEEEWRNREAPPP